MYTDDLKFMSLALDLARKGRGRTSPNPVVGAVIVNDGQIVGQGWHQKAGLAHAEIHALEQASTRSKNATIYVTLEPCCHHGRTGPCTDAIIQAGIKRVVLGMKDPNPLVAGCGIEILRDHGIDVDTGILADEAARLNAPFIKWISCKLPFVTLKSAISLDGKIATRTGHSQWITSEQSRLQVHRMRDAADAVVTGIGTVLADNPALTTRLPEGGKSPCRVVLDRLCRIPLDAKLVSDQAAPTLIFVSEIAPASKIKSLQQQGIELVICPETEGQLDLDFVFHQLGERCLTHVLVEAGGTLNSALLYGNYVDRVVLFMAPLLIGGQNAPGAFAGLGCDVLSGAVALEEIIIEKMGPDLMVDGFVKRRESRDVYRACRGIGASSLSCEGQSINSSGN